MEQCFIRYIYEFFEKLIKFYGFKKKREVKGESYMVEYESNSLGVKIEKYFREFYALLYKIDRPDYEINLFNLLEYLKQDDDKKIKSNYFRSEEDIEEGYKKQINHISSVIYENWDLISDFFSGDNYEFKVAEFERYWKNKYPELYKKVDE